MLIDWTSVSDLRKTLGFLEIPFQEEHPRNVRWRSARRKDFFFAGSFL